MVINGLILLVVGLLSCMLTPLLGVPLLVLSLVMLTAPLLVLLRSDT